MSRREEMEVTILSRDDVTTFPKIATPVINRLITYVGGGLPPATITVEKEKWTPDLERRLIREDIERRLKARPETVKV